MAAAATALLLLLPLTAEAAPSGKLNVLFLVAVTARQPPRLPFCHAGGVPPPPFFCFESVPKGWTGRKGWVQVEVARRGAGWALGLQCHDERVPMAWVSVVHRPRPPVVRVRVLCDVFVAIATGPLPLSLSDCFFFSCANSSTRAC